jgi:hypothetical protein
MYNISMEEARREAVCPGIFLPGLMTLGNFSGLRAKPAHLVGHLPIPAIRSTNFFSGAGETYGKLSRMAYNYDMEVKTSNRGKRMSNYVSKRMRHGMK